ncbi:MAG: TIGR04086 family membrane protein [Lachnospiraceae bacterium]|nr:TIGR04086 family membrane protein [Lachnospiraceae bacterium]
MKQNSIYLLKGLLFSLVLFAALFFFLAFLMYQNGWGESVMLPLIYVTICLSSFLGSFYFSKHAPARRFLWGLLFGAAFFVVYLLVLLLANGTLGLGIDRIFTYLAFFLISGMAGGMLS